MSSPRRQTFPRTRNNPPKRRRFLPQSLVVPGVRRSFPSIDSSERCSSCQSIFCLVPSRCEIRPHSPRRPCYDYTPDRRDDFRANSTSRRHSLKVTVNRLLANVDEAVLRVAIRDSREQCPLVLIHCVRLVIPERSKGRK